MLKTPLCDLLGIDVPVIAAPMGFVTGPVLAAPSAMRGASASCRSTAILRRSSARKSSVSAHSRRNRSASTFCWTDHTSPFPRTIWWRCASTNGCRCSRSSGGTRHRMLPGPRPPAFVSAIRWGALRRRNARNAPGRISSLRKGWEAGGHIRGEVSTMALVPRVVDAVTPVPVAAAGGIADARGLVAALALGAQAVVLGTRFTATPEASAHPVYKQKVLAAGEADRVRTTLFGYGWPNAPHRTLRTAFVAEWLTREARGSEQRPGEPVIGETRIGGQRVPLLRFMGFPPTVDASGDLEAMDFLAGQSVGLVGEIKPAGDIVHELVAEAERIIRERLRLV